MADMMESQIEGELVCDPSNLTVGKGVVVEPGVRIVADKITLGDFSYIGRETRVIAPEFRIGAYTKWHSFGFSNGKKPLHIGRNCWIGGNTVLDSMGGLVLDDGVGIGAHSQIWTHIQFGDIVEGCRDQWYGSKPMHVGKDAWLVGHCIVSPVSIGARAMALVGSLVTKDLEPNHVYAGSPVKDITDKVGPQFEERTPQQKAKRLRAMIDDFEASYPEFKGELNIAEHESERTQGNTCFNVYDRTYVRTYSAAEVTFLKENTPLLKFIPEGEPDFVDLSILEN